MRIWKTAVLVACIVAALFLGPFAAGAMANTGTVSGTVRDANDNHLIAGITVEVLQLPPGSGWTYDTTTDSKGTYSVDAETGDGYAVWFYDSGPKYYWPKYWPSTPYMSSATTFTVVSSDTVTADATMGPGATVAYHLITEATGGAVGIGHSGAAFDAQSTVFSEMVDPTGHAVLKALHPDAAWQLQGWYTGGPTGFDLLPATYLFQNGRDTIALGEGNTMSVTIRMRHVPTYYKDVVRKAGSDRYRTALALAEETCPGWHTSDLVIASGEDASLVDALPAAGLAGVYYCPMLLVHANSVPPEVLFAIGAMQPGLNVHIVGGTSAVSDVVRSSIASLPNVASVDRCAGADRYGTAAQVARWISSIMGPGRAPSTALVANGEDPSHFFDALALSPISYWQDFPVLLTRHDSVPATTIAALNDLSLTDRYIAGGTGSVSEGVRITLGVPPANRLAGGTRFGTAVAIARKARQASWLDSDPMLFGVAATLPDALAAGQAMAAHRGPLLLTGAGAHTMNAETAAYLTNKTYVPSLGYGIVCGGTGTVPESARLGFMTTINK